MIFQYFCKHFVPRSKGPPLTQQQQTVFKNTVGKGEIARNFFTLKQIIVSPFVHISAIISLFAAEIEEPRIDT